MGGSTVSVSMVQNPGPFVAGYEAAQRASVRLARMVARRDTGGLSLAGIVISVTLCVLLAGGGPSDLLAAAGATLMVNLGARRAGDPMWRALALQGSVATLAWTFHETAPLGMFFFPSVAWLAVIPVPRVAFAGGTVGIGLHLLIGRIELMAAPSMWWFVFVGVATTVASALGARERQRFISRRLLRRRVRSQQERVVTEELQRTRQIERSLVEVAANLRQTQDQLEHDVMRRQVLADQLTGAVLKAEEANRAKSEYLARMSHELRTPLNAVIGFSSLIRKNAVPRLTAAEVAYLDRINANGLHLLGLLSDILDISHIEVGRLAISISRVSLARVLREAVEMVQPVGSMKEGVSLRLDVPDESCLVDADPARLRQVFVNLVRNAMKFTSQGNVDVVLVLDRYGAPDRVEVRDTGIGIPPDRQRAVFEPFEQADNSTSRSYGGSGLGLAISRQLCTLMGMTLTLQSVLGRGSTFAVHFAPAARGADPTEPPHAEPSIATLVTRS